MISTRRTTSVLVLFVGIASALLSWMASNTHALNDMRSAPPVPTTEVRRENHLDHFDSDTLAYYLDNYDGYDVAVMFYASWDTNSHQLAPYWNDIAYKMKAGTTQSKLIMSLFDCELNKAHSALCSAAKITHYPTLMFVGSGTFYDTDPLSKILWGKKAAGIMGDAPIPNTVKFQGNWQYTESISDWIKAMQGLSRWHVWSTEGFGKKMRTFFLSAGTKNAELPLGVPGGGLDSSGGSSSRSGAAKGAGTSTSTKSKPNESVAYLQKQVDQYKKSSDDMTKVATRAATMMESVLFGEDATDMFTFLDERKAWKDTKSYKTFDDIQRACVMETSLDYCQRLAEPLGTKVVNDLLAANLSEKELEKATASLEMTIMAELARKEPYCAILDTCIASNMKDKSCRPKKCPFTNDLACRMLTSCQDRAVVKEYADALKLDIDALLPPEGGSKGK